MERDPNSRATQQVQSKNNIIEAGLRKHLQLLQRQCEVNLSQIDQDRLDVRDFLKQIRRCTTDDLPEARHWLGNRTPSGNRIPRTTRLTFRNQSAPTNAEQEEQARQAEQQRLEAAREYEMMGFRSSRPKPELVQRTMALHKLFSKRNLYAGAGRSWDAWGMHGLSDPDPDLDTATVTFGLDTVDDLEERSSEKLRGSKSRRDERNSASTPGHKPEVKQECGRPGCQGHHSRDDEDFMKELLVGKSRKKRKKKEPLQERINGFFDRMEVIKEDERRKNAMPSQIELHRRWVVMTRGVKAALAESSDEEDNTLGLHTV